MTVVNGRVLMKAVAPSLPKGKPVMRLSPTRLSSPFPRPWQTAKLMLSDVFSWTGVEGL